MTDFYKKFYRPEAPSLKRPNASGVQSDHAIGCVVAVVSRLHYSPVEVYAGWRCHHWACAIVSDDVFYEYHHQESRDWHALVQERSLLVLRRPP